MVHKPINELRIQELDLKEKQGIIREPFVKLNVCIWPSGEQDLSLLLL